MIRLKEVLKKRRKSQSQLSLAIGISKVSISRWANGKSVPSLDTLIKICMFLEIELNELVEIKSLDKTKK